jgi:hypothetical protein
MNREEIEALAQGHHENWQKEKGLTLGRTIGEDASSESGRRPAPRVLAGKPDPEELSRSSADRGYKRKQDQVKKTVKKLEKIRKAE